jgi:hypothetical protein
MDVNFQAELESLFRTNFLQAAPLYRESAKFKLPYEDLKSATNLYRGATYDVTRKVEEIADWFIFDKIPYSQDHARGIAQRFGIEAGTLIDGLIRMENARSHRDHDLRNTTDMKAVDVFDHADGRRNFQIILQDSQIPSINGPDANIKEWVGYRFYFCCAVVSREYKK